MKGNLLVVSAVILASVAIVPAAFAQSQPNVENGFKPYGSYDGSTIDTVNTMNGNLIVNIPAPVQYPQRGTLKPQLMYYRTSKNWVVRQVTDPEVGTLISGWEIGVPSFCVLPFVNVKDNEAFETCALPGQGLWSYSLDIAAKRTIQTDVGADGTITYMGFGYSLVTWDTFEHRLHAVSNTGVLGNVATQFDSIDNTGYHVQLSNPDSNGIMTNITITDRAGNQYQGTFPAANTCITGPLPVAPLGLPDPSGGGYVPEITGSGAATYYCGQLATFTTVTDANGNVSSTTAGPDTLNRPTPTATAPADSADCVSRLPISKVSTQAYLGYNGTYQVTSCVSDFPLQTSFGQSGVVEVQNLPNIFPVQPKTQTMVTTIVLPDRSKWTFDYDTYANVTSLGLPLGGSISYTWTTIAFPTCDLHTQVSRAVQTRTINDANGHTFLWTYNWGTVANNMVTNTVTDPLLNDTEHVFTDLSAGGCAFYETTTRYYQGTGGSRKLLKEVDTQYSSSFISSETADIFPALGNVFATDITTTVYPSGRTSRIHRTPDAGLGSGQPIFGNITQQLDYDWGGALLRETDTIYQWQKDGQYLTAHIVDAPSSVVTVDPSGSNNLLSSCPVDTVGTTKSCIAETDYTYDEPAYIRNYEQSPEGGALPAGTHVAAPNPVRGLATSVNRRLNTSTIPVTSHTLWYNTGEPYQEIDPLGHITQHTYGTAYAGAYSTQTCLPSTAAGLVTHCVNGAYDFNTGLLTSFTDQNGQTSNYNYDLMSRLVLAQSPPDPNNGNSRSQTSFTLPVPITLPFNVSKQKSITTTTSDSSSISFDGLGRSVHTYHATPQGTATVDATFDGLDHATDVTNPYFSSADPTYGKTHTDFDALGRPFQVTEQDGSLKKLKYDVVSSGLNGNCSDTSDEASNQRRTCSDALGRLVEVDEPTFSAIPNQNDHATMQTDGNFVLYNPSGVALWRTGTAGSGGSSIEIQDDGNFVLYIQKWQAGTYAAPSTGPFPAQTCSIGNALNAPQTLPSGKCIVSPHGQYMLYMQPDGNLVIYNLANNTVVVTWSTGTFNNAGAYAVLQGDGNLCIYSASGTFLWMSGTNGTYSQRLEMEDDGRIIIFRAAWNSGTSQGWSTTAYSHPGCDVGAGTGWTGVLGSGQCFVSPNGRYEVLMQTDGDLALYDRSTTPTNRLWDTGTTLPPVDPSVALRTLYFYDALGNLTCVEQHGGVTGTGCSSPQSSDASSPWRVRRFTYDSLSRLLTAHNPESGTITYNYDADGNLLQKTSPAPNQTGTATQTISYCYDELHRVTGKAYTAQTCSGTQLPAGTAVVSYTYDSGPNAKGKLTGITDQAGSASFGYDVLGQLTGETRVIGGVSKALNYSYHLNGSPKTVAYPSGVGVTYWPDSAGRPVYAIDFGSNINYATSAGYGPDGQLTNFVSSNSSGFAGITQFFTYNKRLQPVTMSASSPGQTVFSIGYEFHLGNGTSGNDNGNVWNIYNYRDRTRDQSFNYDALNRLTSAQNAGTDCSVHVLGNNLKFWGNTYNYDNWGNLNNKSKISTACAGENLSITVGLDNRISSAGYLYDAAGNMTSDSTDGVTASYDPENRIATVTKNGVTTSYVYDADGNRVKKSSGSTGTLYWYMTPGIVAESDLAGNLKSEYVFFNGERIARKDFDPTTHTATGVFYYFSDHLKTASVITDATGNIKAESDYYPWGGELQFVNNDSNHYKFTGKERDSESGLDYFGARYYSNGLGRFITPDWAAKAAAVPYAEFADPQSLNLYSYVRNLPTTRFDADGHDVRDLVPFVVNVRQVRDFAHALWKFITNPEPDHIPGMPPPPPCSCPSEGNQQNDSKDKNSNNSKSDNKNNQSSGSKNGSQIRSGRPYIRKSTKAQVEAAAKRTPDGKPIDPNTNKPIEGKPDLGHKTGQEFWREKEKAESEGATQKEFNDRMNDPNKYQLEDPSSNRSHQYEQPPL